MKKLMAASALLLCAFAVAAAPESFPAKAVKIVVAQAPGGAPDILARLLSEQLQTAWGQPVLVENRAGAAGGVAASFVAKQPADGHTLLIGSAGIMAIAPQLESRLPYSPDDFAPLAHLASLSNVIVVTPASGIRSVAALADKARNSPKGLSYASLGPGSTGQISAEMFTRLASINAVSIPYKGEPLGLTDLIGGSIDFMAAGIPVVSPYIQSGALVALAVTGARRSPLLPQVPTMAEAGFKGYEVSQWYALYAPARTPRETTARITAAVKAALATDAMQREIRRLAMDPTNEAQQDLGAFEKQERRKWADFVRGNKVGGN